MARFMIAWFLSDEQESSMELFKALTTSFVCALGERHASDVTAKAPKVRKALDELVLWFNP